MSTSPPTQQLGPLVPDTPATPPSYDIQLEGHHVLIVPVDPSHADALYSQVSGPENAHLFTYLFDSPPTSLPSYRSSLAQNAQTTNPWSYTIILKSTSQPVGSISLMNMNLPNRVIEVGSILYAPALQRTPAATEVQYLLARYVFETLGFRRYEWKCNDLNGPSKRAAGRLGFVYEGLFRRHMVLKGRSRDTAWFSVVDEEWEGVKRGFEGWLDEGNFDGEGRQRRRLEEFRG